MAAELIGAVTLLLLVPAVWLARRLKDRWLGGKAAAMRRERYVLALLLPELPRRTGAATLARPFSHARRQSLRQTASSSASLRAAHRQAEKRNQ
ncbi:MAG: hypothetical protein M3P27_08605 [Acidobacteriota bacterium]|nr:hypothetical protein [Acidobacteriota bacterium]